MQKYLLLLLIAVGGCEEKQTADQKMELESPEARLSRWRAEAESKASQACTNVVIGFRRILSVQVSSSSPRVAEWRAKATAEFINTIGGVEVTNVPFTFMAGFGRLDAFLDTKLLSQQEQKAFEESIRNRNLQSQ